MEDFKRREERVEAPVLPTDVAEQEAWLLAALVSGEVVGVHKATPFSESGLMTIDRGLVLEMENGVEFAVTLQAI